MATLKNLIDETTDIKNELIECYANLKNNLIAKGVECSEDDKMPTLIDKVNLTKTINFIPGESYLVYIDETEKTVKGETIFSDFKYDGGYRISYYISFGSGGGTATIVHKRGETTLIEESFSHESGHHYPAYDINNIKVGDVIIFNFERKYNYSCSLKYIKITSDILIK